MVFLISDFRFLIAIKSRIINLELKIRRKVSVVIESDLGDYLRCLEDYETRLARGEINW